MSYGSGEYVYELAENWGTLPDAREFNQVAGVAVDENDRVYIFNRSDHQVMILDSYGKYLSDWDAKFVNPHGIHIAPDGNIYLADRDAHVVHKYSADGKLALTLGTVGRPSNTGYDLDEKIVKRVAGPFNLPTGIAVNEEGYIFVYQDIRGRYGSEGKFSMLRTPVSADENAQVDEATDTYDTIDWLIVRSEVEAILTEANLIKENRPRYNVLLKDDKTFPYIQITNEPYPRVIIVRKNKLSNKIVEAIERGMKYTSVEYNDALSKIDTANTYFKQFFNDYDAILTPSATGEAPKGLEFTGDPIFCTIWTYCGMPSISLPLLQSKNGLPVGVQLVSSLFDDERLFRNANWLTSKIKK